MTTIVYGVSFDAADALADATFWAAVLDRELADGADRDHAAVEPADLATSGPRLAFHRVPEGKTVKNRVHLDLLATDFDAELERLLGLGATHVAEVRSGGHWVTLADPDGNEFDLIEG